MCKCMVCLVSSDKDTKNIPKKLLCLYDFNQIYHLEVRICNANVSKQRLKRNSVSELSIYSTEK